jgi:hypothetical protein
MLKIKEKANLHLKFSGMDSLNFCLDKNYFLNYKKFISYDYNSRGFRDKEWPDNLSDVIWCVGDSFTVGLGQPFEETWPQLLAKKTGKICLNIGEDGCSNDTIALRVREIFSNYQPKLIVVMWSFFNRRRINDINVHYNKKDFGMKNDLSNFSKNFAIVDSFPTNIVHLLVPRALIDFNNYPKKIFYEYIIRYGNLNKDQIKKILIYEMLDKARDGLHFDIKTSEMVSDLVLQQIKLFDNKQKK